MRDRHRLLAVTLALGLVPFAALAPAAGAGAGMLPRSGTTPAGLDGSFGSSGVATLAGSYSASSADAVATIPACPPSSSGESCPWSPIAGDAVSAGQVVTASGAEEYAVEVLSESSGKPATSFGSSGAVKLFPSTTLQVVAGAVAVYPACPVSTPSCPWSAEAGDIVLAGTYGGSIRIVWLSPTGATVGSPVSIPTPSGLPPIAVAVALEVTGPSPSGDLVVAGGDSGGYPILAALSSTGSAVDGFAGSSTGVSDAFIVPTGAATPASESFTGIAADPNGDLVIAGTAESSSNTASMLVARTDAAGSLDGTFGAGGSVFAVSGAVGSGLALGPAPSGSTGCGQVTGCYHIFAAGTSQSAAVAEVVGLDASGAALSSFGGGAPVLLKASLGLSTCSNVTDTGTGIAVQSAAGSVSGIAVTSYVAGGICPQLAVVTRLTPAGGLVTSFGQDGSLALPYQLSPAAAAMAIAPAAGGLDFLAAGTFGLSGSGFATARILGEQLTIRASLGGRPAGWQNADALTVSVSGTEAASGPLTVSCSLSSSKGVTFAPFAPANSPPRSLSRSSTLVIPAGGTRSSNELLVLVPDFTGGTTLPAKVACHLTTPVPVIGPSASFSLSHASPLGAAPPAGYWLVTAGGAVYAFRTPNHGGVSRPPSAVVGLAPTVTGSAYWIATSKGKVYGRDVSSRGSLPTAPSSPVVAIVTDPATDGYWLVERNGSVTGFGAPVFGSPKSTSGAVVGAVAAPDGLGYLMATSSGSVYHFGPGASGHGGVSKPPSPISGIAEDPYTGGYWLVSRSGTVYARDAPGHGSDHATPAVSIACDPVTTGYFVLSASGTVTGLGAPSFGSAKSSTRFVEVTSR